MRNLESGAEAMALHTRVVARTLQASVIRAVYDCSRTVGRLVPVASPVAHKYTARLKDLAVGDPVAIIDTMYDCASDLVDLHREFVLRLIEAAESATHAAASGQRHRNRAPRRAAVTRGLASVTHIA